MYIHSLALKAKGLLKPFNNHLNPVPSLQWNIFSPQAMSMSLRFPLFEFALQICHSFRLGLLRLLQKISGLRRAVSINKASGLHQPNCLQSSHRRSDILQCNVSSKGKNKDMQVCAPTGTRIQSRKIEKKMKETISDSYCQSCWVDTGASAARLTSPADCQFTAANAHCRMVMTTGNDMALPARSCIKASVGCQESKRSCGLKSVLSLAGCMPFGFFAPVLTPACWAALATRPAAFASDCKVFRASKNNSDGNPWNNSPSRPNISRAVFRCPTGSSHRFIFGSMVGATCLADSAFQVKALARVMLWDKSRMRLSGDWTCRSGMASCSLSVRVAYQEFFDNSGCAPCPHLTRKASAIFIWWSAHSALAGLSCWLSSSRRNLRKVRSESTTGSSSFRRISEAQGPCLTHPAKRAPNVEKIASTLLSRNESRGFASTRTKKTYKRRRRAGKPNSQLSVRTGWPSYPCAAIWLRNTSMFDCPPVFLQSPTVKHSMFGATLTISKKKYIGSPVDTKKCHWQASRALIMERTMKIYEADWQYSE